MTGSTNEVKQVSPTTTTKPKQGNTGTIIFIVIVFIIAITALILSIIPFFNKSESSSSECPKEGCDIVASNLSSTNISATNITNKVTFKQGFVSDASISFPSAEYDNLEASEIVGTNISYTNATFTNVKFTKTISEPGIYYGNNTTTTANVRNINITNNNLFYSVELGSTSANNINLLLNGASFVSGQSIMLNCWSRPPTNTNTSVNFSNTINLSNTGGFKTGSTSFNYPILDTTNGLAESNKVLLQRNFTNVVSKNYILYFFNNTFHLALIGQS